MTPISWAAGLDSLLISSLIIRDISDLASVRPLSFSDSIARYNLRSPSAGSTFFSGGKYVPLTVMPTSAYSHIWLIVSFDVILQRALKLVKSQKLYRNFTEM